MMHMTISSLVSVSEGCTERLEYLLHIQRVYELNNQSPVASSLLERQVTLQPCGLDRLVRGSE